MDFFWARDHTLASVAKSRALLDTYRPGRWLDLACHFLVKPPPTPSWRGGSLFFIFLDGHLPAGDVTWNERIASMRACIVSMRACIVSMRACIVSMRACIASIRACIASIRACIVSMRACIASIRARQVSWRAQNLTWWVRIAPQHTCPVKISASFAALRACIDRRRTFYSRSPTRQHRLRRWQPLGRAAAHAATAVFD